MRSSRRRPLLVPVLLCALAVLAARPTDGTDGDGAAGPQVARFYGEAADAGGRYEEGRREAEAQRSKALEYERRLDGQRRKADALREDLGRMARAQYRGGGGLPVTAQLMLADDPDELMRVRRTLSRADAAVDRVIGESLRAETRLADADADVADAAVDQGDRVRAGQWIGQSGSTGNSTGPHLHCEVRVTPEAGAALDPVPWRARRGGHGAE